MANCYSTTMLSAPSPSTIRAILLEVYGGLLLLVTPICRPRFNYRKPDHFDSADKSRRRRVLHSFGNTRIVTLHKNAYVFESKNTLGNIIFNICTFTSTTFSPAENGRFHLDSSGTYTSYMLKLTIGVLTQWSRRICFLRWCSRC